MNNDELLKLLRAAVCSEEAPEFNDATVDVFLAIPNECPPEKLDRIRARFVRRLFDEIHRQPVRILSEKWPLNRWLESMRESVGLTRADIAAALDKDCEFIERLENGDRLPWDLRPREIGDIVCLFRIHMSAIADLVSNSAAVAQFSGLGTVAARSRSGLMSEDRGHSAKRALDLYLARNAEPIEAGENLARWLEELRQELTLRHANHLL